MKDVIFLKGKESAWVGLLLLVAILLFIVPIALIFTVRGIYRLIQATKEQANLSPEVNAADRIIN